MGMANCGQVAGASIFVAAAWDSLFVTLPQALRRGKNKKPTSKRLLSRLHFMMVRMTGLEPTRRKTPDPKSGAATNYATSA